MDYTSTLYPNTLDLSEISDFKDLMTTSRDKDIPALEMMRLDIETYRLWLAYKHLHNSCI